jgi:hypothetical protein
VAYVNKFGAIPGKVLTCKIGLSKTSNFDITPVLKVVGWNEVSVQSHRFVMNKVHPSGKHQGHKHIEGEVRVASEVGDVLLVKDSGGINVRVNERFINPGVDNDECPYFITTVTIENLSGTGTNYGYVFADPAMLISGTASTVLFSSPRSEIVDGEQTEWIYPFIDLSELPEKLDQIEATILSRAVVETRKELEDLSVKIIKRELPRGWRTRGPHIRDTVTVTRISPNEFTAGPTKRVDGYDLGRMLQEGSTTQVRIFPKKAPFLRFFWNKTGKWHKRRSVMRGIIPPNPWLTRVTNNMRLVADEVQARVFRRVLERLR